MGAGLNWYVGIALLLLTAVMNWIGTLHPERIRECKYSSSLSSFGSCHQIWSRNVVRGDARVHYRRSSMRRSLRKYTAMRLSPDAHTSLLMRINYHGLALARAIRTIPRLLVRSDRYLVGSLKTSFPPWGTRLACEVYR
jgi:hypothetical protein